MAKVDKYLKPKAKQPNIHLLNQTDIDRLTFIGIDLLKEGRSIEYIREKMTAELMRKKNSKRLDVTQIVEKSIILAHQVMDKEHSKTRTMITTIHTTRYNDDINSLLNQDFKHIDDPEIKRELRIGALMNVLTVMFQKEKLLQLHNKSLQIRINNKLNAKIVQRKVSYDLSALTLAEKVEFLTLIERTRFDYKAPQVIVANKGTIIEDIEHVEVKDNPLDKMQTLVTGPVTKDQGQTLSSLEEKMRVALAKVAKSTLRARNAKV